MTPYVSDPDFTLYHGDALTVLRELPAESVHCCVTSPPYWGLRDYGTEGQLGLEPTPEEYIARMVEVFREVRRVLRSDGTLWLNLGDSYSSATKGASGDESSTLSPSGVRVQRAAHRCADYRDAGIARKQLLGSPWRVAFALQADGWFLRSDIVWSKPNPMPESVTDRPTKAHEYVFLLTRSPRYFFDREAVREPADWSRWGDQTVGPGSNPNGWIKPNTKQELIARHAVGSGERRYEGFNARWDADKGAAMRGRNIRSVWEIATKPFPEAHFATFPQALVERCVRAGTSERGCCGECGAPWERTVSIAYDTVGRTTNGPRSFERRHETAGFSVRAEKRVETTGWQPTCGHKSGHVPCGVLDPFLGSGTTALVSRRLGRRCVGIELSEEYAAMAARRLSQLSLLAEAR